MDLHGVWPKNFGENTELNKQNLSVDEELVDEEVFEEVVVEVEEVDKEALEEGLATLSR